MTVAALILAAGEGTRMKSASPKVAHRVLGEPMVALVVDSARAVGCDRVIVITGHGADVVEGLVPGCEFVRQDRQLGTGHAVMCARDAFEGFTGSVLVLSGDTPLLRPETMAALVALREARGAAACLLTARMGDPSGYGRILRAQHGAVVAIVEHKDLAQDQHTIDEVNTGTYCFDAARLFANLDRLGTDNAQGEYYLTDLIAHFVADGETVVALESDDPAETMGVNSRVHLAEATKVLQQRVNERFMLDGVTMTDPSLVWIGPHAEIASDVEILPMTTITGSSSIATGAVIGPNTRITDSTVGEGAVVDSSVLVSCRVGAGATVGPVAYLRPGTVLGARAKAGTCVELKNTTVGDASKVPHLSYMGDATIGAGVNVGAGTITCNYDGTAKHATVIEDGAFIGSDTMLIAPVRVGRGAVVGASSAITKDVPDGALALERSEQRTVEGWADRKRSREAGS